MKYAKLIDGALKYAPKTVTKDRKHYNPYPEALLIEDGYKPVQMTPMPDPVEGYVWVAGWQEEDEAIVRTWHKEEAPEEPEIGADVAEQVLNILKGVEE